MRKMACTSLVLTALSFVTTAQADQTPSSFMSTSYRNADFSSRRLQSDICYHATFDDVMLTSSHLLFNVMRFCNITGGNADGAYIRAWMINQHFKNVSLRNARIDFLARPGAPALASEAYLHDSDLRGAELYGDLQNVSLTGSQLEGASLNGRICGPGSLGQCL